MSCITKIVKIISTIVLCNISMKDLTVNFSIKNLKIHACIARFKQFYESIN